MGKSLQTIKHRNLILCEGTDDWNFLVEYLNSPERAKDDKRYAEDVDVLPYDGNRNIGAYVQTVQKMSGYAGVKTLLVIGDAEDDARVAEQRLKSALSRAGLSVPDNLGEWECSRSVATAYLLFPSLNKSIENGAIEHFCMRVIREDYHPAEVMREVTEVMDSLKQRRLRTFKNEFKPKIHGFLSFTENFVGLKIGEAAKAGAFDWGSNQFDYLNTLLLEGFRIAER